MHIHDNSVLGLFLRDDTTGNQKLFRLESLISLKLQDLSKVVGLCSGCWVFVVGIGRSDNGTVASEFLFHRFEELLWVEFLRKTLDGGEGFTTISLLKT